VKNRIWLAGAGILALFALPKIAQAEVSLIKPADNWEVYTSGRVSAFAEYINGQGLPKGTVPVVGQDGIFHAPTNEGIQFDPAALNPDGKTSAFRVRSGFLANILTLGVRNHLTPNTTITAQTSIWATIESQGERTYDRNVPDVREGFVKVDGPGGTLVAGRALSLFGRGATEIDFLYGHGYGVGAPQGFNDRGPTAGHIGFGVLANLFAAGIAYATPSFNGLQLTVGYYDPAQLVGVTYRRTKLGRPEATATFDTNLGETGKLHLFVPGR